MKRLSSYIPLLLANADGNSNMQNPSILQPQERPETSSILVPEAAYLAGKCLPQQYSCIRRVWGCLTKCRVGDEIYAWLWANQNEGRSMVQADDTQICFPTACLYDRRNGQHMWLVDHRRLSRGSDADRVETCNLGLTVSGPSSSPAALCR